ncbi:MAG: UDP-glucose 4-epimerase GalE [bacterium]|jgi:UDP-glucose 4-epimerase
MKKVLVTGGTGYIGSHTVIELIQLGYEVVIIDNLSNSKIDILDKIETITGTKPHFEKIEMCDAIALDAFFEKNKNIDSVIHFAAVLQVAESVENPFKYYNNNLYSTINLLESMKKHQINSLVFSSSCTVYGNPDTLPVDEYAPVKKAMSPYGNTKQMGEEIIEACAKASNINAITLRYFNPIGAHETALIGEVQHGVPHHLIPYITETASGKRACLNVFGGDYNTHDGTCVRDYIHVIDVAKAHISSIERLMSAHNKNSFEVFNIGTGIGYSVLDIINAFEKTTNIKINYKIVDRRPGDVEAVYADTKLANQELGWSTIFNIEDMMRTAWKWEQAQTN